MAEQESRGQAIDLRLVLTSLRRHRGLLVIAATVGAIAGGAVATFAPPPYTSTSVVLIAPSQSGEQLRLDDASYVELAQSNEVLRRALEAHGSDWTVRELVGSVAVASPSASLLEIEVAHPDSDEAAALSSAVADSFVAYVGSLDQPLAGQTEASIESRIDLLQAQASQVDQELASARDRQTRPGEEAQRVREAQLVASLTAERSDLAVQLAKLREQLETGTDAAGLQLRVNARVIDRGDLPVSPSQAVRVSLGAVAGASLGLALGAAIALRRTREDRALRSSQALARVVGAPLIAGLRARPQRSPEGWRTLLGSFEPPSADLWSVRRMLRWFVHDAQKSPTMLMISFSGDREGQSIGPLVALTAASLGVQTSVTAVGDPSTAADLTAGLSLARRKGLSRDGLEVTPAPFDSSCDLRVLLTVVDPVSASFADLPEADSHFLCVGPGVVTIDDVSRLLIALDSVDRVVSGVLLANPAEWDDVAAPVLPPVGDDSHASAVVALPPKVASRGRARGNGS